MATLIGAHGSGDIVVNGRRYPMPPGGVGSVTVRNGVLMVNGRTFPTGPSDLDLKLAAKIEVQVSGGVQQVKTDLGGKVVVYGAVGSVETVNGDVVAEGGVTGSVSTVNGNVTVNGEIGGNVNGNVRGGTKKKRKAPAKAKKPPKKKQRRVERKQPQPEERDLAEELFEDMFQGGAVQIGVRSGLFPSARRAIASMFRSIGDSDDDELQQQQQPPRREPQGVIAPASDQLTGDCAICLCALKNASQLRILDCMHKFCEACYAQWERVNERATCPVCRS